MILRDGNTTFDAFSSFMHAHIAARDNYKNANLALDDMPCWKRSMATHEATQFDAHSAAWSKDPRPIMEHILMICDEVVKPAWVHVAVEVAKDLIRKSAIPTSVQSIFPSTQSVEDFVQIRMRLFKDLVCAVATAGGARDVTECFEAEYVVAQLARVDAAHPYPRDGDTRRDLLAELVSVLSTSGFTVSEGQFRANVDRVLDPKAVRTLPPVDTTNVLAQTKNNAASEPSKPFAEHKEFSSVKDLLYYMGPTSTPPLTPWGSTDESVPKLELSAANGFISMAALQLLCKYLEYAILQVEYIAALGNKSDIHIDVLSTDARPRVAATKLSADTKLWLAGQVSLVRASTGTSYELVQIETPTVPIPIYLNSAGVDSLTSEALVRAWFVPKSQTADGATMVLKEKITELPFPRSLKDTWICAGRLTEDNAPATISVRMKFLEPTAAAVQALQTPATGVDHVQLSVYDAPLPKPQRKPRIMTMPASTLGSITMLGSSGASQDARTAASQCSVTPPASKTARFDPKSDVAHLMK